MWKRGLRKLCDVYDPKQALALDAELLSAGIVCFREKFHPRKRPRKSILLCPWPGTGTEEFTRYFVDQNDLARATNALPLTLRGFRAVTPGPSFPEPPEAA